MGVPVPPDSLLGRTLASIAPVDEDARAARALAEQLHRTPPMRIGECGEGCIDIALGAHRRVWVLRPVALSHSAGVIS